MKKSSGYMDRALRSRDPRFARVLDKLGHTAPKKHEPSDHLDALRAAAAAAGIDVDGRWGEARLRAEISKAKLPTASIEAPEPKAPASAARKKDEPKSDRYSRRDMRAKD